MQHIDQTIQIDELQKTHITIKDEGHVVRDEEGHTFVGNYIKLLYSLFGCSYVDFRGYQGDDSMSPNINQRSNIADVYDDGNGNVRVAMPDYWGGGTFWGHFGHLKGLNSQLTDTYYFNRLDYQSPNNIYEITDGSNPIPFPGGTFEYGEAFQYHDRGCRPHTYTARDPWIEIGASTKANAIDDWKLDQMYPDQMVSYSNLSISAPVITDTRSEITISTDVTNNYGSAIDINEIGLFSTAPNAGWSYDELRILLAREVLSNPVSIASGATKTIEYKIRIDNTSTGGLLIHLNEILYRHLTWNSRESKDIFNLNKVYSQEDQSLQCALPGGRSFTEADQSGFQRETHHAGPQLGTSDGAVSNTNFTLQQADGTISTCYHGKNAGELFHFGTTVHSLNIDTGANRAEFEIGKIFQNKSGSDITIREIGLQNAVISGFRRLRGYHCLYRDVLPAAVTLADGEYAHARITFAVEV